MAVDESLITALRDGLTALANPAKAPDMQRYMKSEQPFLGVAKPERARLARAVFAAHPPADRDTWLDTVRALWRRARCREERYLAIDLTGWRGSARWQTPDLLPLYEELVVTGAWWDFVDEIAARRVGPLLRAHPDQVRPAMLAWARDPDRWKRRTAIICQLGSRSATDTDLLADAITANLADRDFFLRKGIGWALREHAKTDPAWVRAFVAAHPDLSPLSRREALRRLDATPSH